MKLKTSRGIVTKLICCMALVVLASAVAFSQTPKSGALFSMDGTAGATAVHIKIYDSQIHTATVRSPAGNGACSAPLGIDDVPTDAYVLQGGAPTGCDPGDPFETSPSQQLGSAILGNFTITTKYPLVGNDQTEVCESTGNTSHVCIGGANPSVDTGFLTVTNNSSTTNFTGTITLAGTSGTDVGYCSPGNTAITDSFTGTLAAGASRTFALAQDSSNCGGFNQAQHLTISNSGPSTASFGKDAYIITPSTAQAGDTLDVLPIPLPSSFFVPGTSFSTLNCIPYADFSAAGNPVCVELQVTPNNNDSYIYTVQNDFNIDKNSHPVGVGGPALIGRHGVNCPPGTETPFDTNIFLSYTAPSATFGDPLKGSGSGGGSCWVATFDPNAGAVSAGAMVGFFGFQSPVVDTKINVVKAGSSVPIKWQQFKGDGTAETGLSWCPTLNTDQKTCSDTSVQTPWVFLGTIAITCPNDTVNTATDTTALASGKSGFQQNFPSDGFYQFNWQTVPKSTGCVALVLQYDTGIQVFQAIFKYSKT